MDPSCKTNLHDWNKLRRALTHLTKVCALGPLAGTAPGNLSHVILFGGRGSFLCRVICGLLKSYKSLDIGGFCN
jgi:hypothetical protein